MTQTLSQQAALIAAECIQVGIQRLERGIKSCGELTHKDAKQSDSAKDYFNQQLESGKKDIGDLKKLSADLTKRAWQAFEEGA